MCAIAGLIRCGDSTLLQRMCDVQSHRGPDSQGSEWWTRHGSGLGHRRLAILDLSPAGHQPMATPDGRHWITFNGEVYNFQEIRRELEAKGLQFRSTGDTEVILRAYEMWGAGCLNRFNGMFAFAIFDTRTGRLFAARDQIGIKPFYYWQRDAQFAFASEVKALLQCPFIERKPDYESLLTPARFQISPSTGFAGIAKLPPAHHLTFENGTLAITRYWKIEPEECLLAHDELDLEPGVLRLKEGGGLAGHNGLRSIEQHLKTRDFVRVRIGVGKPRSKEHGADHVLSKLGKRARDEMDVTIQEAAEAVEAIVTGGIETAMNRYNTRA